MVDTCGMRSRAIATNMMSARLDDARRQSLVDLLNGEMKRVETTINPLDVSVRGRALGS
jgi:hypothetical protein